MRSETNCETWTVLTIVIIVVCENCGGIPCLLTITKTHTDVNYSTDLWLIFQSPTAERRDLQIQVKQKLTAGWHVLWPSFVLWQCPTGGDTMAGPPDILWHEQCMSECVCVTVSNCLCGVYDTPRDVFQNWHIVLRWLHWTNLFLIWMCLTSVVVNKV